MLYLGESKLFFIWDSDFLKFKFKLMKYGPTGTTPEIGKSFTFYYNYIIIIITYSLTGRSEMNHCLKAYRTILWTAIISYLTSSARMMTRLNKFHTELLLTFLMTSSRTRL